MDDRRFKGAYRHSESTNEVTRHWLFISEVPYRRRGRVCGYFALEFPETPGDGHTNHQPVLTHSDGRAAAADAHLLPVLQLCLAPLPEMKCWR